MRGDIELEFADGRYRFRLTGPGIDEIQRKCNAGMGEVYARVITGRYVGRDGAFGVPLEGRWRQEDLIEIIRQGLIGGNQGFVDDKTIEVPPPLANSLIENYVRPPVRPLSFAWGLAAAIVFAAIEGMEDPDEHPVKKKGVTKSKGGSTTARGSRTSRSAASARSKRAN